MNRVVSAGGIVVAPDGRLVIVQERNGNWGFPKGHIEPGETPVITANREVLEETGLTDLRVVAYLGSYNRPSRRKSDNVLEDKTIHLYLFADCAPSSDLAPRDANNPAARWATVTEALETLSSRLDRVALQQRTGAVAALTSRLAAVANKATAPDKPEPRLAERGGF